MFKSFIKESDCNSSNVMFSGRYKRSKLSIDDESSHLINGSNTNNKIERKRNINMLLNDEDKKEKEVDCCDIGVNISVGGCDDNVHRKKIKIDDEQEDNNKRKMYQVSFDFDFSSPFLVDFYIFFCTLQIHLIMTIYEMMMMMTCVCRMSKKFEINFLSYTTDLSALGASYLWRFIEK
jgi:hypothetical protein